MGSLFQRKLALQKLPDYCAARRRLTSWKGEKNSTFSIAFEVTMNQKPFMKLFQIKTLFPNNDEIMRKGRLNTDLLTAGIRNLVALKMFFGL